MFSETNFGVIQTNSTISGSMKPLTFFQNTFKVELEANEKEYVLEKGKST